ncbi:MAG: CARDB domain-containing protein [Candidatus Bathyarchaeota archaeon]|jgi:hypothetical protein
MQKSIITSFLTLLVLTLFYTNTIHVVAQETHDIMVVSVTPSPTDVQLGELVNITVVVSNRGTENETFDLTAYYETNAIETKPVLNLAPNTNTTLFFLWNTTDASTGIYTIKAEADHLPEETITEDNTLVSPIKVRVSESPYIIVIPASTVDQAITPGLNYTISIYTDYDGDDVWGYEFELAFNPNVLEGVEVVNGDLITDDAGTTMPRGGQFNNTAGRLSLTGNAFFDPPGEPVTVTSGPGTMANITFTVVGRGDSHLVFGDTTRLIGYNSIMENFNIIDENIPSTGHILGGYFSNQLEVTHDIAIVSVTPSTTEVEESELLNVAVVVENQGTVTEDAIVEVYRDYEPGLTFWLVGSKSVNLAAGTTESLVFVWNTTDVRPGNHTVTAVAIALPGEVDVEDNVLESGTIVTIWMREEQPIPILLILGIATVVVVAIALIWYALKRRSPKRRSKGTR